MSRWLFLVNDFAELDHMLPIVVHLARDGGQIETWVGMDESKLRGARLELLHAHSSVLFTESLRGIRFSDFPIRALNRLARCLPVTTQLTRKAGFFVAGFHQNRFAAFAGVIWGWGDPNRFPFHLANILGTSTICVPHGFNVFATIYPRDADEDEDSKVPNFAARNRFSRYVVNNRFTREFLELRGMSGESIVQLGNLRFTKSHNLMLIQHSDSGCSPQAVAWHDEGPNVVLFLPNPNYRVNWKLLTETLGVLSATFSRLVVVRHFREPKSQEAIQFDEWCAAYASTSRFAFLSHDAPELLVCGSKLVLFSGASVGILGLLLDVPAFHLTYLTRNPTIFEELKHHNVAGIEDLKTLVATPVDRLAEKQASESHTVQEWFNRYVHGSETPEEEWLMLFRGLSYV